MNSQTGSQQFANGLVIQSDGRLEGASTIIGDVTDNNVWSTGTGAGTSKVVGNLTVNTGAGATVDLANNSLIVTNTPASTIAGYIKNARDGGAWDLPGMTSSAAKNNPSHNTTLGVLTGAEYSSAGGTGTFAGFPYAASDTLVKYTYYGDTDFNGVVNFDDYGRIDAGFNSGGTDWFQGDFDGNGIVNFDDYALIDAAFNSQNGTLGRAMAFLSGGDRSQTGMQSSGLQMVEKHFAEFGDSYARAFLSAVPEPTSLALIGLVSIGCGVRVRRRRPESRRYVA